MTCAAFLARLDSCLPFSEKDAALAHARTCARCGEALAAARLVEEQLAAPPPAVSPAFIATVLARVRATRQGESRTRIAAMAAALRVWSSPDPLPWWVRAAAEPAAALSVLLAGLVLWRPDRSGGAFVGLADGLGRWASTWTHPSAAFVDRTLVTPVDATVRHVIAMPGGAFALTVAFLPLLLGLSFVLYRGLAHVLQSPPRLTP